MNKVAMKGIEYMEEQERTLYDYMSILASRKKNIILLTVIFAGGALLYALFAPKIFRAECRILAQSLGGGGGTFAMLSAQASNLGITPPLGGVTRGEMFIGLLRGHTVIDKIIDRFDLMDLYEKKTRIQMRQFINAKVLDVVENTKSGIVTIAVMDKEPERAARMANAFVEELKSMLYSLAIGEAAERRVFFEQQMTQARVTLNHAEDELQKYQEQSGLVAMEPQVTALLESIAQLRAQIAAKEVELSSLRTYARSGNPSLKRAESELATLRLELNKLGMQQVLNPSEAASMPSLREAPQLGLEYQRRLRNVKYASTMYDLMLRQLEAAKIDEAREAMPLQIIDPAIPPDDIFKPKKLQIVMLGMLFGLCLSVTLVLFADYMATIKNRSKL